MSTKYALCAYPNEQSHYPKQKNEPTMFNRIFKFSALTAIGAMVFLAACQQDDGLLIEDFTGNDQMLFRGCDPGQRGPGGPGGPGDHRGGPIGERCFDLVFPVTLQYPDETTKKVATKEEYTAAIAAWVKANPRSKDMPKIAFPYEIMLKDGTVLTIETIEELKDVLDDCRPNSRPEVNPCYSIVFPVTVKFPDSTTAKAGSAAEMAQLIQTWRTKNPNSEGRPSIVFPYSVTLADGSTVTINNMDDIRELNHSCRENRPNNHDCFSIVYPVTVVFPDSTEKQVADRAAFLDAVRAWRTANPSVKGRPTLKFPFSVKLEDGTTKVVNNKDELRAVAATCKG